MLCLNIALLCEREEHIKPHFHHFMATSQSIWAKLENGTSDCWTLREEQHALHWTSRKHPLVAPIYYMRLWDLDKDDVEVFFPNLAHWYNLLILISWEEVETSCQSHSFSRGHLCPTIRGLKWKSNLKGKENLYFCFLGQNNLHLSLRNYRK